MLRSAKQTGLRRHARRALLGFALLAVLAVWAPGSAVAGPRACTPTLSASASTLTNGSSVVLAGDTCSSHGSLLAGWDGKWHPLGRIIAGPGGHFVKRVRVRVHDGVHTVKIKAASPIGISPQVKVKVADRAAAKEDAPSAEVHAAPIDLPTSVGTEEPGPGTAPPTSVPVPESPSPPGAPEEPTTPVEPEEPAPPREPEGPRNPEIPTPPGEAEGPRPVCSMSASESASVLSMTEPGCTLVASDTAAESNPLAFWSQIGCVSASRYSYETSGGDTQPTATGSPQGNEAFRRLTVLDGDELYGSRCELGENNRFSGHTAFYHQGEHLATYMSIRLPENFPLSTDKWQVVAQMKQAQPSNAGGGAPILDLEARDNQWILVDSWNQIWSVPAQKGVWTRFAWNVYYSNNPGEGWVQLSVDANGDGDFDDPGERSPVFHVQTLKTETAGSLSASQAGVAVGAAIPSHLRMGIYHDPSIPCPPPDGCSVDVDNVQVLAPH